jgi:hypothetical protein
MFPRDVAGRALYPSVLSALLCLTSVARAQEEAPAADKPPGDAPDAPAAPATESPPPPPADATATGSATATAEASATTPAAPPATPAAAPPKPPPLALEILPSTAYPADPLPGIRGGSLSLSINHLQWPYMPKYAGEPDFRIGFSGGGWVDASTRDVKAGEPLEDDQREYRMQGRFTFRVSGVYNRENDWFIMSNTEFVANAEQNNASTNYVDVDDAYLRLGKWKWGDVTVGRVQGFEVYHFGMGLDLNTFERRGAESQNKTPAQPYALDDLWDRGVNNGALAFHWYYPKFVRVELLGRMGVSSQGTLLGFRPVGIFDLGFVKARIGYERVYARSIFIESEARAESKGIGGSIQGVLDPWVELGGNYARRVLDGFDQGGSPLSRGSHTTTTWGGFLNVRPYFENWLVGVGYNHTYFENFEIDAFEEAEHTDHTQMFGALQYLLWDRFYIKYVFAYSKAEIEERNDTDPTDNGITNEALSHRLRFMLLY